MEYKYWQIRLEVPNTPDDILNGAMGDRTVSYVVVYENDLPLWKTNGFVKNIENWGEISGDCLKRDIEFIFRDL